MSAHIHRGRVYFVACGKYVKIGYSSGDLGRRLAGLAGGRGVRCPEDFDGAQPLNLIHVIPGCVMRDERRLHGLFAAHRATGEWYHLSEAFIEQLGGLQFVTDYEVLRNFRDARRELKRRPSMVAAA